MPVTWEISDGSPNFWLSDSIAVADTAGFPVGFNFAGADPPWPRVQPKAGTDCYVWVKVRRTDPFDVPQTGKLRLFVGRAGPHFVADDYEPYPPNPAVNANLLDPPDGSGPPVWDAADWTANLTGKKVVPIRRQVGPAWRTEFDLDAGSSDTPLEGGTRWLQFVWEGYRIPPPADVVGWHVCVMAYVHDALSPFPGAGSAYVESYGSFAQSNFGVTAKRGAVKRRVVLGNGSSRNRRLGVRVWAEGAAAEGALIRLRFCEGRHVLERLQIGDQHSPCGALVRPTASMRPTDDYGHPVLRTAPDAWGVRREGGALRLAPLDSGFVLPVTQGEILEAELTVLPGRTGDELTVHLVEFDSEGLMPGGVSFKVVAR